MDTETDPFIMEDKKCRHDVISVSFEVTKKLRTFVIRYKKYESYSFGLIEAIASFDNILVWDANGDKTLFGNMSPKIVDLQQYFPSKLNNRQSLAYVVLNQLGKLLNKSYTCSRWTQWPLRPEEILYSASDAEVLLFLKRILPEDANPVNFATWEEPVDYDYKVEIPNRVWIDKKFSDKLDSHIVSYEGPCKLEKECFGDDGLPNVMVEEDSSFTCLSQSSSWDIQSPPGFEWHDSYYDCHNSVNITLEQW